MENQKQESNIKLDKDELAELKHFKQSNEFAVANLRKIELQQKAILNNIPDIAWLKDMNSRFIEVNEAFAKACGFKAEEIVGKTDFELWPRDLAERYRADDLEVINSRKRKSVEERLVNKEDGERWIETVKTPVFDDQGEVIGTTGIARNITQRKKEEEEKEEK